MPDGRSACWLAIESEDYDVHSEHVLCCLKETGIAVACARLILPGPKGLNVNARYTLSRAPESPEGRVGEIGRLALSSSLRRHRAGSSSIGGRRRALSAMGDSAHSMLEREGPVVALGLYREMFHLGNRYGIAHCYADMEPALGRLLLSRLGFPFHEAGPLNTNVTPARQSYLIGAYAARAGLAARNSCLYRFMFGGEKAGQQVMTTSAAWRVTAEPWMHRGLGLHI